MPHDQAAYDIAQIDRLSQNLMAEFKAHYEAYLKLEPDTDRRIIFEGWIIQKIAGIHYMLKVPPHP